MTDRAIIRQAVIAREYDRVGRPHCADIIKDAMLRLADGSAVGNWWNGVKQFGSGLADDAKAFGNAAWNNGIRNAIATRRSRNRARLTEASLWAWTAGRSQM